jgi:signal peptidase I
VADGGSSKRLIRDYGMTILAAVVVALLIRFVLVEAYRIPSSAMKPTLEPGDTIFVSKWPFGLRFPGFSSPLTKGGLPERGDVVVFSLPQEPWRDYIKRVLGLPGDEVAVKNGEAILNGKTLRLDPGSPKPCTSEKLPEGRAYEVCSEPPLIEDFGPEKVPPGSVFVVGDFRAQNASDHPDIHKERHSKGWGLVPVTSLKGRALWVWLSVEPHASGVPSSWFPQFRFDRMFRRIQ